MCGSSMRAPGAAMAAFCALLAGCGLPGQPLPSAFSRNVGFGSTVLGVATNDMGSAASGDAEVLGAPSAGGIGGNSQ